jgi:hypothetical protein
MPTFIKPGFWNKKRKQLAGELDLDYLIQSLATTRPYKTYTAILTQTGENPPVEETVFENTLGDPSIVFARTSPGSFQIQHPSFLVSKTYIIGSFRSVAMTGPVENLFSCVTDGTVGWVGVDSTFAQPNRIYIEIRVYS